MQKDALVQATSWNAPSGKPPLVSSSVFTLAGFVQSRPSQVAIRPPPTAAQKRAVAQEVALVKATPAAWPADHVLPSQMATPSPAMQKVRLVHETV
jgi:hypothetical protein